MFSFKKWNRQCTIFYEIRQLRSYWDVVSHFWHYWTATVGTNGNLSQCFMGDILSTVSSTFVPNSLNKIDCGLVYGTPCLISSTSEILPFVQLENHQVTLYQFSWYTAAFEFSIFWWYWDRYWDAKLERVKTKSNNTLNILVSANSLLPGGCDHFYTHMCIMQVPNISEKEYFKTKHSKTSIPKNRLVLWWKVREIQHKGINPWD